MYCFYFSDLFLDTLIRGRELGFFSVNNFMLNISYYFVDLPPGAPENTHTSASYQSEEVDEGPPLLPPRVNVSYV